MILDTRINTYTTDDQTGPSVATLTDGSFVVTWVSGLNNPFGDGAQDGSSAGIYGQRYDASGNALDSEFRVNTYTTGNQADPSVAALTSGGFVVTWMSADQDDSSAGIYGQRYDLSGNALGSEFRINSYVTHNQMQPSVTALTGGVFWWFGILLNKTDLLQEFMGNTITLMEANRALNFVSIPLL